MRRMGIVRSASIFAALLLGVGLLAGCSDEGGQSFMEVEPTSTGVAIFDDVLMEGGEQLRFYFNIASDMISPEIRANWTVINREIFIDMYLILRSDYKPELLPPDQPKIFWSSVPELGPEFGDRRGTSIILHPCEFDMSDPPVCRPEGAWVILFYNPQLRTPVNRSAVSATVNLRFFQ
jgi:hypothetical protein